MKRAILFSFFSCLLQCIISCTPLQEDADETLGDVPLWQLPASEKATKNDTSTCIIISPHGRLTVTDELGVGSGRGYYELVVSYNTNGFIILKHEGGSYNDIVTLTFSNRSRGYELNEGVYTTNLYSYGCGRVEIGGKYMYWNGSSYGNIYPRDAQKI